MARSLVALSGGLSRSDGSVMAIHLGDDAADVEVACCMICGCPEGPCASPGGTSPDPLRSGADCPLSPRRAKPPGAVMLRDPELLSLATASMIVIASVLLVTL